MRECRDSDAIRSAVRDPKCRVGGFLRAMPWPQWRESSTAFLASFANLRRAGATPWHGAGPDAGFPPGWWILPGAAAGLAMWIALFRLL
jgi:hypothetical protein